MLIGGTPMWHIQDPGSISSAGRRLGANSTSIYGVYATIVNSENIKNHLRYFRKRIKKKRQPRLLQEKVSFGRSELRHIYLCLLNNVPQEVPISRQA